MLMKHGLEHFAGTNPTILILGTLPGDESLRQQQYYANPKNQFWNIISMAIGKLLSPMYSKRLDFLNACGIALWDVLQSAEREGSLDSSIKSGIANNFVDFFVKYPTIKAIGFNGGKAHMLYKSHITKHFPSVLVSRRISILPSTSPTPGKNVLSLNNKVTRWKEFLSK